MERFQNTLYLIAKALNDIRIDYMISGSMAGKFYGLKREPHDIDIYVFEDSLPQISKLFGKYITKQLYHCKDDFYDEYIIELEIDGVKVELCLLNRGSIHSLVTGEEIPTNHFYETENVDFRDTSIKIQSLKKLIEYKSHNTNQEFAKNQIEDVKELITYLG